MSTDIHARCACGTVQATLEAITPDEGNHLTCHCTDCQTYIHHLNAADSQLDEWGGTTIFQTTPIKLKFTKGIENVACLRLSEKGLHRWYAACCQTPIGNTAGPGLPFVGLMQSFLARDENLDVDRVLGPVKMRVQLSDGIKAKIPKDEPTGTALSLLFGFGFSLLKWRLRGDHKSTPFFKDGAPMITPTVLTLEERQTSKAKCL